MPRPLTLLAFSGSLRAASTNTALLNAAKMLVGPDVNIDIATSLGALPHFNPDLDRLHAELPEPVAALRRLVGASDGVLIASPEYAHGVPGTLKNALDWLVSGPEVPGKPVAVLSATTRGAHAHAALIEVLRTMSATVVAAASVDLPLVGTALTAGEIAADPRSAQMIRAGLQAFVDAIRSASAHHPHT